MEEKYAKVLDAVSVVNEDALYPTDMEEAIIGIVERFGMEPQIVLDKQKCLEILMRDGGTYEEALEHFEFNVIGAWMGDHTPLFMTKSEDLDMYG